MPRILKVLHKVSPYFILRQLYYILRQLSLLHFATTFITFWDSSIYYILRQIYYILGQLFNFVITLLHFATGITFCDGYHIFQQYRCIIQLCGAKILDSPFKSWCYPPGAQRSMDIGPRLWNGLHSALKLSSNANTFKQKIKDAFFSRLQKENSP